MIETSKRVEKIEEFRVMDLLRRANELAASGKDIIHMEIGEPGFRVFEPVVIRGIKAIQDGMSAYTEAQGILSLRESISNFYYKEFGVKVSADRVFVTTGASGALLMLTALLLDHDENLLITDPGYPCSRNYLYAFSSDPVLVPVGTQTGYKLTSSLVESHWNSSTKGVLISSPSNPTGAIYSSGELGELSETIKAKNGFLLVDEVYQGFTYKPLVSSTVLSVEQDAFVVNSFSKFFGMTGWRIGWIVAPESVRKDLLKLAQNFFICAPSIAQHAALDALTSDALIAANSHVEEFRVRRDFLVKALRDLGFFIHGSPLGAFYIYARLPKKAPRSKDFCLQFLESEYVAVTPGYDFGKYDADHHVRFSFTQNLSRLEVAIERLSRFSRSWK